MKIEHQPVVFECEGSELVGIIEHPEQPRQLGVLIVTGGPQYRIGSHRQFVSIARALAESGIPVMRFDYRGMGDSGGEQIEFDQSLPDLKAAIDNFVLNTKVRRIALWGLCDAASACMIYSSQDPRVVTCILLNPWVRTDTGLAQVYVKHYYLRYLRSREFWEKLVTGRFELARAAREFLSNVSLAVFSRGHSRDLHYKAENASMVRDFREKMFQGLKDFKGPVLFLLSGDDLTAAEFINYTKQSRSWRRMMRGRTVTQRNMAFMDHTFSTNTWREEIISNTIEWIDEVE